ncbi:hypothetical protein [Paenibacillus sp. MBLB4367]|uniref:hypothetical protein n=1 Tax=Paenibacillus sp. MBLB4367 TaxID=3384767 RepID=UPI003907EF6D
MKDYEDSGRVRVSFKDKTPLGKKKADPKADFLALDQPFLIIELKEEYSEDKFTISESNFTKYPSEELSKQFSEEKFTNNEL